MNLKTTHTSGTQKNSNPTPPARLFCRPRKFENATRLQNSFTAATERKALLWLAARMPSSINSDHLTVLGFAAMFLAGCSYALARWTPWGLLLATVFLALNWLGDSLDGTLARVRNRQRPRYGFYVDHIVDTFAAFFLMGGLALSGYIRPAIAFGLLVAFLMLSIEAYLTTYTLGQFQLSYWKFGPTEIRLLLAAGNVGLFCSSGVKSTIAQWSLMDVG